MERDVASGAVTQIGFDGDSASAGVNDEKVPIVGVDNLRSYSLFQGWNQPYDHPSRMGVATGSRTFYFDPMQLSIDPGPDYEPTFPAGPPWEPFASSYPRSSQQPFGPGT
jgi:hypothetical protein